MADLLTRPEVSGRFNIMPLEAVLFGPGKVRDLAADCERLGITRAIVVASPSLAKLIDVESLLRASTGGRIAGVFTAVRPHVPHDVVLAAAAAARALGADGIISIGGGSPIDLAKSIGLAVAEDIKTREDLHNWRVTFEYPDKITIPSTTKPQLPHIAISTTLSAGEFTSIVGVTDTVRQVKDLYITPSFIPRVIVLDPELAVHTPRSLWASTGLRAVDHAVEALCSASAQPLTDALCQDALVRLATYLPVSSRDGSDLFAAGQCQVAAWESIFGLMNVNLGLSHGIGHQLGARCGVPHGVTSCVMLPTVLDFNHDYTRVAQDRIAEIFAEAAGARYDKGTGASDLVRQFIASLDLPTTLREVGVDPRDFAAIAHDAMEDMIVASNPRPVADVAEVVKLLERAY